MKIKSNHIGLTSKQASQLLNDCGPNTIDDHRKVGPIIEYLNQFRSPLVIILLLSATVSLYLGQTASAIIIMIMVVLSTSLDFINSYRSQKAADDLAKSVRINARVYRDGKLKSIPVSHIVPGDVVELEAGSIIPADGKVIESVDLSIDESAMSGEAYPVGKNSDDAVHMGTSTVSGRGTILITATGKNTEYAHIAKSLKTNTPSEFDLEIAQFSTLIAKITMGLVLFIIIINILFQRSAVDSLLFALALAVGLTPEMLPLIITINLSKGSMRMAKKGAIVKRLSAIQNFGAMNILCTDKTGTLTENKIQVHGTHGLDSGDYSNILSQAAIVCNFSTAYENPLDVAILNSGKYSFAKYKKIAEIPFDFERRRESVVVAHQQELSLISKGAGESMLAISTSYRAQDGTVKKLTLSTRKRLEQLYTNLSSDGLRILAVASKTIPNKESYDKNDEIMLTFEGFITFIDPPKASSAKFLRELSQKNVAVKIITGDDPLVAAKVASELGIDSDNIITGDQIANWNQTQLANKVNEASIFARVNPNQKLQIIQALRSTGNIVGYMGDGINDAPSLKAADVGISVNNAVDVARDAADVILLGKSLGYLIDGIIEGRRTFANTMKYLKMALSSNFGNVFSMAGSSLFLPFLPMTAPQILFNNLLYDTSQFAIPSDRVDAEQLSAPRHMNIKSVRRFMWVFGGLSSIFDFITFAVLLLVFHANAALFQTGWFIESLATQILVVFVFRTKRFALASRPSKLLILSILAILIIACGVALTSIGASFGFVSPNPYQLTIIAIIVISYLSIAELLKHFLQNKFADM